MRLHNVIGSRLGYMGSIHIDEKFYIALLRANRTEDQLDNSAPLGSFFQIRKVNLPRMHLTKLLRGRFDLDVRLHAFTYGNGIHSD